MDTPSTGTEPLTRIVVDSPVGPLRLSADEEGRLSEIRFCNDDPAPPATSGEEPTHPVLVETRRQLEEYFAGERVEFDLPLGPVGSRFQREVWDALTGIPYAETASYGDIARQVTGDVTASRAVGLANGQNPLPIIVPCHRVVGANRTLVGFGGGLERKRILLELEARVGIERQFAGLD